MILFFISFLLFSFVILHVLLHFYSQHFSLHQYPTLPLLTFVSRTVQYMCMDLILSYLFFLILSLLYFIPIPICPTFPTYCVPVFIFSFLCMPFPLCLLPSFRSYLLIYLHVTVLTLVSYWLTSFRSGHDISHIYCKFTTLYLISANSISCIPSPYSSVFFISFLYIIFLLLFFSILLMHYFICVHGISLTFPTIFSFISFLHIAVLCTFHFWFHIRSTQFLFMSFTLFSLLSSMFTSVHPTPCSDSVHFSNVSFSIILVSFHVCSSVYSSFLISHMLYVISLIFPFICLIQFLCMIPLVLSMS